MFERCLYFNTNALARRLNARWEAAFARFDLSPSHGYLLRLVLSEPGLSQQAVADALRLEKSTVARFVAELEKRELLERRPSDADQREKTVHPTPKSLAMKDDLQALGDRLYAAMRDLLGEDELAAFVKTLRRAAEKL